MYILPQIHKCNKCGHEESYSPHNPRISPFTSEGMPICGKCWDKFVCELGTLERLELERNNNKEVQSQ